MFLCPNQRLALFFRKEYKQTKVFAFSAWLEDLWQSLSKVTTLPRLLTGAEQLAVFEEVINHSALQFPLLRKEATTALVIEAWELMHEWDLFAHLGAVSLRVTNKVFVTRNDMAPKDYIANSVANRIKANPSLNEETQVFLQWVNAFQEKCQSQNWLDRANLLDYLSSYIAQDLVVLPKKITCLGFVEWTPQQQKFLSLCEAKGVEFIHQPLLASENEVFRLELATEEAELLAATRKAKHWLEENPGARIGIIIPDLAQKRFAVQRILAEHCQTQEYNIAAPLTLAQYPIIDAVLLALNLMQKEIPFADFSKILRLAFFGDYEKDLFLSPIFEVQLREMASPEHSLAEYIYFLDMIQKRFPKLSSCQLYLNLKECLKLLPNFYGKKAAESWKILFTELLTKLGWPGSRELNAEEFALKEQWEELLLNYTKMQTILGDHSYNEAVRQIRRLANYTQFLAKSESTVGPNAITNDSAQVSPIETASESSNAFIQDSATPDAANKVNRLSIDASIQVLGLLEGLGFPFDYLWVMGLHRDVWPSIATPNPFIPLSLQIKLKLPHSSAARELAVAERITRQLAGGPKTVIFSYPSQVQEQLTTVSPLLAHFPEVPEEEKNNYLFIDKRQNLLQDCNIAATTTVTTTNLRSAICENGPSIADNTLVSGGSNVLKLQAICPFRSFAEIRLKAQSLKNPRLGLSLSEKGEMLHQVLVLFWQDLKSQAELLALTAEQRQAKISAAISQVFAKNKLARSSFTTAYLELEKERIAELLHKFLELEASRPPFEVIAHEKTEEISLGKLRFKLRIDRIDKLENGDELLIDYKTGQVQISEWFGERPIAPQLPLYCIARKTKASAVAFAIIRADELKYRGLADDVADTVTAAGNIAASEPKSSLQGIESIAKMKRYGAEDSFALQTEAWETSLEKLALEFKNAHAVVQPLKGEQSCRTCHLKSVCRLNF